MDKIDLTTPVDIEEKINDIITLLVDKPDNSWLKADIQDWLKVRNISFTDSETKTQLLEKM
jgi:hypothetical protein